MLRTAAGRCYLAFCPDQERRAILEMLSRSKARDDRGARETRRLNKLLDAIRAKGYAVQDREINPKATGIAVPIRMGSRVLASLSSIWISSALTIEKAETELLPLLTSTASRIVGAVSERTQQGANWIANANAPIIEGAGSMEGVRKPENNFRQ